MKKCYTCGEHKQLTEFNKNKKRKDGLNSICRECSKARSKQYYKENKEIHKQNVYKRKKKELKENQDRMVSYLLANPCVDCGESNPVCLDFDHQRDKKMNVSLMLHGGYCWDSILKEIDKCEVRCANCHRKKTSKEFNWFYNNYDLN
jgi:hypothetical protein